jgi:chromosome segregation ATPase
MPTTELESAEREHAKLAARRAELQTKAASTATMLDEVKRDRARAAVKGLDTQQLDKRVAEYLALSETLADAVREADLQISLSENALADQRDHQARAGEVATVKAAAEEIERAAQEFQSSSAKLVAAIGRLGDRSPEMLGISALVEATTVQIPAALATAVADLQSYTRGLRAGTEGPRVRLVGLKPLPQPVPTPKPDGPPSGIRYEPPKGYRERHPGF